MLLFIYLFIHLLNMLDHCLGNYIDVYTREFCPQDIQIIRLGEQQYRISINKLRNLRKRLPTLHNQNCYIHNQKSDNQH